MEKIIHVGRNLVCLLILLELLFIIVALFHQINISGENIDTAIKPASADSNTGSFEAGSTITFSVPSGFYTDDFFLELSAPDGFSIYYTLDGAVPTANSYVYTYPIFISLQDFFASEDIPDATIVRAIAMDDAGVFTDVFSATYLLDDPNVSADRAIISVVTDPDNLYDPEKGIYVAGDLYERFVAGGGDPADNSLANYLHTGRLWERPGHIDYFDMDRAHVLSQEVGIRINGASSRLREEKSLRFYARREYDGNNLFTCDFFDEEIYLNSVILRKGLFINQFLPSLVPDRHISIQDYVPCVMYLNGIYQGDYCLLERYDSEYFEAHYNIPSEQIAIIKDGSLFEGSMASAESYVALYDYMAENDLSIPDNYDYVCSQLDVKSYIDYYCTQLYINNYDFGEGKNTILWRSEELDPSTSYADGKWRFCLMDVDLSLTSNELENYRTNSFTDSHALVVKINERMFHALFANADFRQQFVTTFLDIEQVNFDYDTVASKIDTHSIYFESPETIEAIKEFFQYRPEYINRYLADVFELNGVPADVTLTIDTPDTGVIRLNSVTPNLTDGSWTGQYYTDYPVTVTALPAEGFRFESWLVNGEIYTEESLTLPLTESGLQISAIFMPE